MRVKKSCKTRKPKLCKEKFIIVMTTTLSIMTPNNSLNYSTNWMQYKANKVINQIK